MTKILFALAFAAMLVSLAAAQGRVAPPATLRQGQEILPSSNAGAAKGNEDGIPLKADPPFCPRQTCLYYAGDFDYTEGNGLLNANSGTGTVGQVWVGVKPARDAVVTGATFNECMTTGQVGTNPTPFEVRVGIRPGQAGKAVCTTSGTATIAVYEESQGCFQWSYTIKKLTKSCNLRKNAVYFVNLLPTYNDGSFGYVTDVEDKPAPNHHGWRNILDASYFNSADFGANYEPTWGSSGACDGYGCDLFSIALTGKEKAATSAFRVPLR